MEQRGVHVIHLIYISMLKILQPEYPIISIGIPARATVLYINEVNHMRSVTTILFIIAFISAAIFFGELYPKLNFSYSTWRLVAIITVVLFVLGAIIEKVFTKKDSE